MTSALSIRKKKVFIAMISFLAFIFLLNSNTVFTLGVPTSPTVASGDADYSVVHVLNSRSGGIRKYIYKDLNSGIRRIDSSVKLEQVFITNAEANDELFSQYDVVVVHSTRKLDTLDPEIEAFVQKNAKRPNLFVVAYLPKNKRTLSKPPSYVDVISSSSKEDPAARLVISELAPKVYQQLK